MSEPAAPNEPLDITQTRELIIPKENFGLESKGKNNPNQDNAVAIPHRGRFAVMDGVGGIDGGANAANAVSESAYDKANIYPDAKTEDAAVRQVKKFLTDSHAALVAEGKGMTTATFVQFIEVDGQKKAVIGNSGDSRAYLWNEVLSAGTVSQLTTDDDIISEAFTTNQQKAQELREKFSRVKKAADLTKLVQLDNPTTFAKNVWNPKTKKYEIVKEDKDLVTERELFNNRNTIFQALGHNISQLHIDVTDVKSGDVIILTSDGIHDNLIPEEIAAVMASYPHNPQQAANALVAAAKLASLDEKNDDNLRPKDDDMTALVIKVP